jgi:hypothetical protein
MTKKYSIKTAPFNFSKVSSKISNGNGRVVKYVRTVSEKTTRKVKSVALKNNPFAKGK